MKKIKKDEMDETTQIISTPVSSTTTTTAAKAGFKTSEFWLSLVALFLPVITPLLEHFVGSVPAGTWQATVGGYVVVAAYALSRALVKKPVATPDVAAVVQQIVPAAVDSAVAKLIVQNQVSSITTRMENEVSKAESKVKSIINEKI